MYIFYFVDVLKTIKDPSCLENVDHLNDNRHKNLNFLAAEQKQCICSNNIFVGTILSFVFCQSFLNKICQTIPRI